MNRYEKHYLNTQFKIDYVRDMVAGSTQRFGYWCTIDELIENPELFPEQTLSLEDRRDWAMDQRDMGRLFVVSGSAFHPACLFSLSATRIPPPMRYRHVSKVWRDANEQV